MYCKECGKQLTDESTACPQCGAKGGSQDFQMYEYASVIVQKGMETLYADCYAAFGWLPVNSVNSILSIDKVSLSFKRNRIKGNAIELAKLQKQCVVALQNLGKIEAKKASAGMIPSLSVGVISALVLGGGMSLCLRSEFMVAGILVGIAGMIGCSFPYFIHKKINEKGDETFTVSLNEQYDKIGQICDEANRIRQ